MKVKTKIEFALHVDNYKNVDILTFQEGFYHLRFIIYVMFNDNSKQVLLAQPIRIVDLDKSRKKFIQKNKLNSLSSMLSEEQSQKQPNLNKAKTIIAPHVFKEYHAYCTKSFLVRQFFEDEVVNINEICIFELELDHYPLRSEASIMIDVELMYAAAPSIPSSNNTNNEENNSNIESENGNPTSQLSPNQIQFNCISLYKAEIAKANITSGIHEYVPIIFDEDHFNLVSVTLHSAIVDFCYSNDQQQQQQQQQQQENKSNQLLGASDSLSNSQKPSYSQLSHYTRSFDVLSESQSPFKSSNSQHNTYNSKPYFSSSHINHYTLSLFIDILGIIFWSTIDNFIKIQIKANQEKLIEFYENYVQLMRKQYEIICSRIQSIRQYFEDTGKSKDVVYAALFEKYQPEALPPSEINFSNFGQTASLGMRLHRFYDNNPSHLLAAQQSPNLLKEPSEELIIRSAWSSENTIESLVKEINNIHKQTVQTWYKFQQLFLVNSLGILKKHRRTYNRVNKKLWEDFICLRKIQVAQHTVFFDQQTIEQNTISAKLIRRQALTKEPTIYNAVKDIRILPDKMLNPVIFQSIYSLGETIPAERKDTRVFRRSAFHLFVFVHGFQGNAFDMRLIKNHMMLLYPECLFLLSVANEGRTEGDIGEMGRDLAREITDFVQKWCPGKQLGKISFIAHSLGGVIVRAALPHLKDSFKDRMYSFLSLGVPHLGYLHSKHSLINIGLWFLKTWRGSTCLSQLEMKDNKDFRQTFLYNLSKSEGLQWFRNVVFCSSSQDHYVPLESARIEQIQRNQDSTPVQVHNEMVRNLMSSIANDIQRLDIDFEINEKGLDSFIEMINSHEIKKVDCLISPSCLNPLPHPNPPPSSSSPPRFQRMGCANEKPKTNRIHIMNIQPILECEEFGLKRQNSQQMYDPSSPKGMISQHLKQRNSLLRNQSVHTRSVKTLFGSQRHIQDKRTSVRTDIPFIVEVPDKDFTFTNFVEPIQN